MNGKKTMHKRLHTYTTKPVAFASENKAVSVSEDATPRRRDKAVEGSVPQPVVFHPGRWDTERPAWLQGFALAANKPTIKCI